MAVRRLPVNDDARRRRPQECGDGREMSCFVMRPAGNVMFCHGPPRLRSRRGLACPREGGEPGPCEERGHIAHRSSISVPFSPPPACGAGPCFARIARGRPSARCARLITRAKQSTHLSRPFRWGSFSRRCVTGDEAAPRMPLPSSKPILPRVPRRSSLFRNYFKFCERTAAPGRAPGRRPPCCKGFPQSLASAGRPFR